jgi:rhodanese-related sulfurtransferase
MVVYWSGVDRVASVAAYTMLTSRGYVNVRRYAGGLIEWEQAGYSLEGGMVG